MAIQEHLDILQQGTKAWNIWKAQQRTICIDLSRANLSDANLSKTNLSKTNLSRADFRGANLNGANLNGANLSRADLSRADLNGADLSRADLNGADLNGADLSRAYLSETDLNRADLSRADLRGAYFRGADLRGANLNRAYLSVADLSGANLSDANLNRAYLGEADLSGANLSNANLSDANLNRANLGDATLRGANLSDATLSGANLSGTDLSGANLSGTDLSGANLSGTDLSGAITSRTIFNDLDLRAVKGLETIYHLGPSGITTSTLERSEGDIPDVFLREAGLSETFITYARSLVQTPIQYYTCFISYSSKDQKFAERLRADLVQKGIKCWFAPEDLKIGDKFPHHIEEAIRLYDKLLIILSQNSIHSSWVKKEAQTAEEKEERLGIKHPNQTVLFPIKIDNSIEQCRYQWVAKLQRERHIGDFTRWKYQTPYDKAFQRLLYDLQPTQQ